MLVGYGHQGTGPYPTDILNTAAVPLVQCTELKYVGGSMKLHSLRKRFLKVQ